MLAGLNPGGACSQALPDHPSARMGLSSMGIHRPERRRPSPYRNPLAKQDTEKSGAAGVQLQPLFPLGRAPVPGAGWGSATGMKRVEAKTKG